MTAITKAFNHLQDGNEITGRMLADILNEFRPKYENLKTLYERYKGTDKGVPILTRQFPIENTSKINNKLANDFFSDIIHTKVGYFMGHPVTYKYPEIEDFDKDILDGFLKRNAISDLDSETAKMAAICGYAVRFLYIDLDGRAAVINVPPWECVFISDEIGVSDADYAIRFYPLERENNPYIKIEFFDNEKVTYWIREGDIHSEEEFILDPQEEANPVAHMMDACPLICFPNNEELLGDCEKVISLIDGYDKTMSDINSEIEQFRLAYMVFIGMVPDEKTLDQARQTGCFGLPAYAGDMQPSVQFVTKQLNTQFVEAHLERLEENILYFAQSVRFADEAFGQASGVAMKFKLFSLEAKCMTAERKFQKALIRQFTSLLGYYGRKGRNYDPYEIEFVFVRNFPLNLMDEASSLATLTGLVSKETALAQMSFIEDPMLEIEKIKAEEEEYLTAQRAIDAAMQQQETPEEISPEEETTTEESPESAAFKAFGKVTGG